ncbi:hypothetical protein HPB47_012059, partial [Ixodes persulcatus]
CVRIPSAYVGLPTYTSFCNLACEKISGGASPNDVAMASSDHRNVASLSHLSVSPVKYLVSPSPADAARPEKGETSLPSSPYILCGPFCSTRLRESQHKHDAQQQATTLHNIQAELRSFRQEPRQGGKQPPSSYAAATSLQDPVDLMRDERGNTRPVTKATCAPGAAVPAAIGGARSVASILDSRMHPRHQDKLNLDGGGFHETRPKLPRTGRPLLKGSALQAHIEQSGTLSELACTRLKTRHDGYSSF